MIFGTAVNYEKLLSKIEFRESPGCKSYPLPNEWRKRTSSRTFHIYYSLSEKFGAVPLNRCKFRQNCYCERQTLLKGVSETLFVISTCSSYMDKI
jgi:hypothetical protein